LSWTDDQLVERISNSNMIDDGRQRRARRKASQILASFIEMFRAADSLKQVP